MDSNKMDNTTKKDNNCKSKAVCGNNKNYIMWIIIIFSVLLIVAIVLSVVFTFTGSGTVNNNDDTTKGLKHKGTIKVSNKSRNVDIVKKSYPIYTGGPDTTTTINGDYSFNNIIVNEVLKTIDLFVSQNTNLIGKFKLNSKNSNDENAYTILVDGPDNVNINAKTFIQQGLNVSNNGALIQGSSSYIDVANDNKFNTIEAFSTGKIRSNAYFNNLSSTLDIMPNLLTISQTNISNNNTIKILLNQNNVSISNNIRNQIDLIVGDNDSKIAVNGEQKTTLFVNGNISLTGKINQGFPSDFSISNFTVTNGFRASNLIEVGSISSLNTTLTIKPDILKFSNGYELPQDQTYESGSVIGNVGYFKKIFADDFLGGESTEIITKFGTILYSYYPGNFYKINFPENGNIEPFDPTNNNTPNSNGPSYGFFAIIKNNYLNLISNNFSTKNYNSVSNNVSNTYFEKYYDTDCKGVVAGTWGLGNVFINNENTIKYYTSTPPVEDVATNDVITIESNNYNLETNQKNELLQNGNYRIGTGYYNLYTSNNDNTVGGSETFKIYYDNNTNFKFNSNPVVNAYIVYSEFGKNNIIYQNTGISITEINESYFKVRVNSFGSLKYIKYRIEWNATQQIKTGNSNTTNLIANQNPVSQLNVKNHSKDLLNNEYKKEMKDKNNKKDKHNDKKHHKNKK